MNLFLRASRAAVLDRLLDPAPPSRHPQTSRRHDNDNDDNNEAPADGAMTWRRLHGLCHAEAVERSQGGLWRAGVSAGEFEQRLQEARKAWGV